MNSFIDALILYRTLSWTVICVHPSSLSRHVIGYEYDQKENIRDRRECEKIIGSETTEIYPLRSREGRDQCYTLDENNLPIRIHHEHLSGTIVKHL